MTVRVVATVPALAASATDEPEIDAWQVQFDASTFDAVMLGAPMMLRKHPLVDMHPRGFEIVTQLATWFVVPLIGDGVVGERVVDPAWQQPGTPVNEHLRVVGPQVQRMFLDP